MTIFKGGQYRRAQCITTGDRMKRQHRDLYDGYSLEWKASENTQMMFVYFTHHVIVWQLIRHSYKKL